jgi:RHS repeat-associated protein
MLRRYFTPDPSIFCLLFASAAIFLMFGRLALGQVNPGTPSWSAYDSHLVDTVNLQNLNVILNIPVMSKSGAFPFRAALVGGDSYIFYNGNTLQPGILAQPISPVINGILSPSGFTQVLASKATSTTCPSGDGIAGSAATQYSGWYLQMTDGTVHNLPSTDIVYGGTHCSTTLTDQVIDSTGWTVTIVGGTYNEGTQGGVTVFSSGGLSIEIATATIQDQQTTPNKIYYEGSEQEFFDTLGTEVLTFNANAVGQLGWFDVNGGNPTESQTFTDSTLKTSFGCSGKADYPATGGNFLTTAISFPDDSSMGFTWEPNGSDTTGRLEKLTLREGGTVTYNYNPSSGLNDGLNCTYLVPNKMTRTTSDGATTYSWNAVNNGGGNWGNTTTVVDQGGNETVYWFTGLTASGLAAFPTIQPLTRVYHYQGSSTLLSTDLYCYNGASSGCAIATVQEPVTEVDLYHTIPNLAAGPSRTRTQYDGGPTGSCATGQGGCYGNVTYSAQYDFGATSPTVATTTAYGSWNGTACVAISSTVNNKPCQIVTTQSGNTVAQSRFTYDSKGNLLTTYKWTGSSWLSNPTANSYNSSGTPNTIYDLTNHATTYQYSSSSYVQCSGAGCTNLPFPTSITKLGLTTSSTWNGTGGVKLSDTDANGNTTKYCYNVTPGSPCSGGADPFWRIGSITDPLGNTVQKYYYASGPDGPYTQSYFAFGSSVDQEFNTVDGYGRPIFLQKAQRPDAEMLDTVSTTYGWSGVYRSVAKSLPCSNESLTRCTSGIITTLTDLLGRPYTVSDQNGGTTTSTYTQNDVLTVRSPAPSGENTKQVQNQYDGLGRLQYSCAIGSVSGNAACNQNTGSSSGVTTSYLYPSNGIGETGSYATRGAHTRSETYDSLGRVVSSNTPESGNTIYTYDTVPSSCSSEAFSQEGVLISVSYANGNFTCYQHDPFGRLTTATDNGGPGGSAPCRRYYYDNSTGVLGAIPSGITIANPYGHMVEAETDTCAWPVTSSSIVTDEWFSYDADGKVTAVWEMTPHSGSGSGYYYHSTVTYNPNGTVNTLQLANPSLYSMTYGLDGEGRWNTLSEGSSQNLVTSTTYTAASQPTEIALNGTDQDDYTYDPNTELMTGWTFQVNSETETGALTWNQNHTLRTLKITDGFNSGGSQTCNFGTSSIMGYDDIGRLLSDNCGSVWQQTFSYDQYDDITKSGSLSWNPGYNSSNNQYTLSGTSYDGSGNLLNDTFHSYTWNAYNKLFSIDSSACGSSGECITYDALGRIVEVSNGSAYTEIWYTPLGKTAYMNGTTINYAYIPTPGGGTVEVVGNAGSFNYFHKDWLGNARILSDENSHNIIIDQAFAPYGEIYQQFGSPSPQYNMFTGDTQDILATGDCCFDTPNRELSANQGRWLSPDPAGTGWNQYAYTTNPNSLTDALGLAPCASGRPCVSQPPPSSVSSPGDEFDTGVSASGSGDPDESASTTLLYTDGDGNLVFSPDGGQTWWFVGSDGNAWFSADGGQTWDVLLPDSAYTVFSDPALQTAANVMNDPMTYVDWFAASGLAATGVLSYPAVISASEELSPEFISNAIDFVASFDPNPAAPLAPTIGGVLGWMASGGARDLVDALVDTGNEVGNYVGTYVSPQDQAP